MTREQVPPFDQDEPESPQHEEVAPRGERRRFNRRSFIAGAGVMALIAGGLTLGIETTSWNDKMARFASNEQALVGKWQRSGLTEEKAEFLFRAGTIYRQTPDLINDSSTDIPWLTGNQAGKVGNGDVMLVKDPIMLKAADGTTWLGFEQGNGSVDKSTANLSEEQIANNIDWIDYSALQGQKHAGQPMVTVLSSGGTQPGNIYPNGQIVTGNGTPAGYEFTTSVAQYQQFGNFFKG